MKKSIITLLLVVTLILSFSTYQRAQGTVTLGAVGAALAAGNVGPAIIVGALFGIPSASILSDALSESKNGEASWWTWLVGVFLLDSRGSVPFEFRPLSAVEIKTYALAVKDVEVYNDHVWFLNAIKNQIHSEILEKNLTSSELVYTYSQERWKNFRQTHTEIPVEVWNVIDTISEYLQRDEK